MSNTPTLATLTPQNVAQLIGDCLGGGESAFGAFDLTSEGTSRDGVLDITVWDADDNQREFALTVREVTS